MTSHYASLAAPVHKPSFENAEAPILSDGGLAWDRTSWRGIRKTVNSNQRVGNDRSDGSDRRTGLVPRAE